MNALYFHRHPAEQTWTVSASVIGPRVVSGDGSTLITATIRVTPGAYAACRG